jgi:hypothetical protein
VDDRDILCVLHDALDRIRDVEDETGGQLAFGLAGVNETRCVRDELPSEHDRGHVVVKELLFERLVLGPRDMADNAADDVVPAFDRFAMFILERISFADDFLSVEPERHELASVRRSGPVSNSVLFEKTTNSRLKNCAHKTRLSLNLTLQTRIPDLILF